MRKYSLKIYSDFSELERVEDFLWELKQKSKIPEKLFDNIILALFELISNAITHGNQGDKNKQIVIEVESLPGKILFKVKDEGNGFDISRIPDPTTPENIFNLRGRGLYIAKKLSDGMKTNKNTISIFFYYGKDNAPIH